MILIGLVIIIAVLMVLAVQPAADAVGARCAPQARAAGARTHER